MTYEFKFTPEVLNIIAAGLRKLPYEMSASLLDNLQREVQAQDEAAQKLASVPDPHDRMADAKERKKPGRPPKAPANGAAEQQALPA